MAKTDERQRLFELTKLERQLWAKSKLPAGMDEVGRGPLAGPVVTCCVILPQEPLIEGINDSKKVTALRRARLAPIIESNAIAIGYGWNDAGRIDEVNILNATKEAFVMAYDAMGFACEDVLIDAVKGLNIAAKQHSLIHGDAISYLIGAASIAAKVKRDEYMIRAAQLYPQYGFEKNKGYGTKEHIEALKKYGPCPIHRRSFIGGILGEGSK